MSAKLTASRMSNNTPGAQIDDFVGALETNLCDLLGITLETTYTAGDLPVVVLATEKATASGVATLNASALVIQNPAAAVVVNPVTAAIPLGRGVDGRLDSSWGGLASSLATLNSAGLVTELPAVATVTAAATSIPLSNASSKISADWLTWASAGPSTGAFVVAGSGGYLDDGFGGTAGSLATLDSYTGVVQAKYLASAPTSFDGTVLRMTADGDISAGQIVFVNTDGLAELATNTVEADMGIVGVAVDDALSTETVTVLLHGVLTVATDYGSGSTLYVGSTAGSLTSTVPSGSSKIKAAAVALGATQIVVSPDAGWKLPDSGVYSNIRLYSALAPLADVPESDNSTINSAAISFTAFSTACSIKRADLRWHGMVYNNSTATKTAWVILAVQKGAGSVVEVGSGAVITMPGSGLGVLSHAADITTQLDAMGTAYTMYLRTNSTNTSQDLISMQGSFEANVAWQ